MSDRYSRDSGRDSGRNPGRGYAGRGDDRDRDSGRGGRDSGRGGSASRFTYQARDPEEAKRRAEGGGDDFDVYLRREITFFKPADRDNAIRILPPTWEGAKHYGMDVHVHYGVGPDRQTYLCLHKMKGERCPICEERAEASRKGDEEYAKELAPKRRVLVYVIDRNNEREGPMAWAMPQGLDQDITKVSIDRRTGAVLYIDHPDEGFDVFFEKNGTGIKTKYEGVSIDRNPSRLGSDAWLDFAMDNPLPDQLVYYDYDRISEEFGGGGGEQRTGRDRDDRGRSRGGRDDPPPRDEPRQERGRVGPRESTRSEEPELTWDSIHAMVGKELDALVELKGLTNIDPNKAESDMQLADWICEDLNITQQATRTRVAVRGESAADPQDRLAQMREQRDRR